MTQTAAQTKQQQDRQVLLALAAGFGAGTGGYIMLQQVRGLLMELSFQIPYAIASWLATMTAGGNHLGDLGVPDGPCQVIEAEHADAWLAMYLVAAAGRMAEALPAGVEGANGTAYPMDRGAERTFAQAQKAEQRYFEQHVHAEQRRMRSAALQDMAALLNADRGDTRETPEGTPTATLLGWRTVMDERTTFECKHANGLNFRADRMPIIGWPGAVHVRCRCSAGPEVPGAPVMPSV